MYQISTTLTNVVTGHKRLAPDVMFAGTAHRFHKQGTLFRKEVVDMVRSITTKAEQLALDDIRRRRSIFCPMVSP